MDPSLELDVGDDEPLFDDEYLEEFGQLVDPKLRREVHARMLPLPKKIPYYDGCLEWQDAERVESFVDTVYTMRRAAWEGDLNSIMDMSESIDFSGPFHMYFRGHIVRCTGGNDCVDAYGMIVDAAWRGHSHVIAWLFDNGVKRTPHLVESMYMGAVRGRQLKLLAWIRVNTCLPSNAVALVATECGYMDALKWMYEKRYPPDSVMLHAIKHKQQEVVEWCMTRGLQIPMEMVALGGISFLEWLKANHFPFESTDTIRRACNEGLHAEVKWLIENGAPQPEQLPLVMIAAARAGNIKAAQDAQASGEEITQLVCNAAASAGHVSFLEWARKEFPDMSLTEVIAVGMSHPPVMDWCIVHGSIPLNMIRKPRTLV